MMRQWMGCMCVLVSAAALAGNGAGATPVDRYARRCQPPGASRIWPAGQGPKLWGTLSGWEEKDRTHPDEKKSVLMSASLEGLTKAPEGMKSVKLEGGHLSATTNSLKGAVLRGESSDGKATEVAICEEQPDSSDPQMIWYQIQAWNPVSQEWENPCAPNSDHANPRALVLGGFWDGTGAHHDAAGKITFACETGDLSKCATWGYKPWASRDGRSLADAHQACTRMARADYCGDGVSHTKARTLIEYYDSVGVSARMTKAAMGWDPAVAKFEAAWGPDGASCLARTRHGEPLEAIQKECQGRFKASTSDLGGGDRCAIERTDASAMAGVLRNRIDGGGPKAQ